MTILLFSALTGAALSFGAACGTAPDPALADVIYEGGASEQPLKALLAVTPKDDPQRGAEIDNPPDKTLLPPSPIPTFQWHPRGATAAREPFELGPQALLPREPRERSALGRLVGPLKELLGPEREARAEQAPTPMDGTGYFLVFSTDMKPKVLRVFTTKTSYTPDAKAWDTLSSLQDWTTLSILTASFSDNQLSPTGGPWKGVDVQFCIER
jgi:hypothetical protein